MEKNKNNEVKLTSGLFIVYFLVLIWIILFKMQVSFNNLPHFRGVNLIPFAGSVIRNNHLDYNEIILNMIVFIPFGLYLSMIKPNWFFCKKIISIAGVSLLFELLQFIFAIGATDITDLISNTLGGAVGIGFYFVFSKILKHKTNKVLSILALIGTIGIILLGILISRMVTFRFKVH
ncbi:VanZ family protein [Clostridium sp. 'White wine YQ']|uniref:VanZ family protein n=1 Tax=Clostridium sp. 'White wine YQ' TaxID=3027474 RepID=UPI002365D94C|nr:VanZ family protein [Clostridium sp. 'White wine YQ']MDD7794111.1 VanZ family protein [Clostridium sp. 'White wine YQ']